MDIMISIEFIIKYLSLRGKT
ncbi:hypothetical protein SCFA_1480008 [anaerobic digester metagenome]|uniref:Uncharacterized protein n=1 Tax=anaerobic digester metagenome TaxID=1263854 RepID=A0A485LY41_9ZZZZ